MTITEALVGRTYPPTAPYEVTAGKIAEFAAALGDDHPAYAGPAAIAPPTFVAVVTAAAWDGLFSDPELGLSLSRIVHGDQRFEYARPVRTGDVLTAELTIDKIRVRGSAEIIGTSVTVRSGVEDVCVAAATLVHNRQARA